MHSATTTSEMSPSELAKCRENLKRQWENRRVDEALLRRAWETAHRVATVLYQNYGAEKVAVFGSLAERGWFTKHSDIDIMVWGLSYNKCLEALWQTDDLGSEFKIDIIDFETSSGLFRKRVMSQAIPIKKGERDVLKLMNQTYSAVSMETREIYQMSQIKLVQRISDERTKIERTVQGIANALQDIEKAPPNYKKYIERTIATDLADVYRGIERIFERIAREVDMHTPRGSRWHNDLLEQMGERQPERPPVISQETLPKLKELLDFRHKVNNIYSDELIYEKAEEHAKPIAELFATVFEELDTFAAFLTETHESDAKR
ncbi:MAG: nucleotidyltransferase domain-containing protein [Candidatus Poribacteria bacterium]|nr:nucleotidyltransferase domain-containing protein [Candidatus Poribacteria bacterium]